MRHGLRTPKLSRNRAQRVALKRSLVRALFIYEQIKTTLTKAKVASAEADKLITLAKKNDLHARRQAYSYLNDHAMVKRLFDEIAPRFNDVNGGYTRVLRYIKRQGDNAQLAVVELTKMSNPVAAEAVAAATEAEGATAEKKGLKGLFKKKEAK